MKTLSLTLFLTLLATPAFAAKVDPACGGSKLLARGTMYLVFSLGDESIASGDQAYDRLLSEGVKNKFSAEDSARAQAMVDANPRLVPTLALKAEEFRARGLKGATFLEALVNYYLNPENGLCEK